MDRDTTGAVDSELRILGRAVRALRRGAGITQRELSQRVGTSEAYISNIELGRRDARWSTLRRILRALDADLRALAEAVADIERDDESAQG